MSEVNAGKLLKSGEIVSPKGRLLYPALFTPSAPPGEGEDKKKYQATLLFPKGADLDVLANAVNKAITDKWGPDASKKHKIKKPFIKTEEQPRLADYADDYPIMIRTSSKDKPQVVFASTKLCNDEAEVYSGRWGKVLVNCYAWEHKTGGKGVSFGLQHVQILDNDEPLVGAKPRPEDAFEAVGEESGGATSAEDLF